VQAEAREAALELLNAEREVKEATDQAWAEAREAAAVLDGRGQAMFFISTFIMTVAVAAVVGLPIYRRWREGGGRAIEELNRQKHLKADNSDINMVSAAQSKDVVSNFLAKSDSEEKKLQPELEHTAPVTQEYKLQPAVDGGIEVASGPFLLKKIEALMAEMSQLSKRVDDAVPKAPEKHGSESEYTPPVTQDKANLIGVSQAEDDGGITPA
jgi:hypothetical protein